MTTEPFRWYNPGVRMLPDHVHGLVRTALANRLAEWEADHGTAAQPAPGTPDREMWDAAVAMRGLRVGRAPAVLDRVTR